EVFVELAVLFFNLKTLFLGEELKLTLLTHLIDFLQTINAVFDGDEVGECSTEPAFSDVVLSAATSGFLNDFDRLFFRPNESHATAVGGHLLDVFAGRFGSLNSLLKVNDMDPAARRVNKGLHAGIPALGLMSEVDAC